jgi:hypothetical protein
MLRSLPVQGIIAPVNDSIFERLDHEWHGGGEHVSGWFHRRAPDVTAVSEDTRRDSPVALRGDTIDARESQATPLTGAAVSLKTLVASMETDARELLSRGHRIADEYIPQAVALGEMIESNPVFLSASKAMHVPQSVLAGIAALLDKVAAEFPAPEAPADPELAEITPAPVDAEAPEVLPADPETDHVAA